MSASDLVDAYVAAVDRHAGRAYPTMRVGLGVVILLAGAHKLVHPDVWTAYAAPWVLAAWPLPMEPTMVVNGAIEVAFGVALIAGVWTTVVAGITAVSLAAVLVNLASVSLLAGEFVDVLIRDAGLTVLAVAVTLEAAARESSEPAERPRDRRGTTPETASAPDSSSGGAGPPGFTREERRYVETARVGRLATADADARPHVLPVCFVLVAGDDDGTAAADPGWIATPIDEKPKAVEPSALRRVRDVRENASVALLVDHWSEDWDRLGWVQVRGTARVVEPGDRAHADAVSALRRQYDQYADHAIDERPILRIDPGHVVSWGTLERPG